MESGSLAHSTYALMSAVFRPLMGHMDRHKITSFWIQTQSCLLLFCLSLFPFPPFFKLCLSPSVLQWIHLLQGDPAQTQEKRGGEGGGGWGLVKIWKEITERDFLQLKNQAKYPCKSKSSKTILFITQTDANSNVCVISSSLLVNVHHSHKGSHNSSID